ncbi:MAG: hypothetical protein PHW64_04205 [Sulfuricurvum sp.]|nr:hypothetical protein [Sulfuricurvum sp.]
MITVNLILTIIGLMFVLTALVALYVWSHKKTVAAAPVKVETFESLGAIIKNPLSSAAELHHAVEVILRDFSAITSSNVGTYIYLLETLCVHPHTDSKLILRFEKSLRQINPKYAHEIEQALGAGLAARG